MSFLTLHLLAFSTVRQSVSVMTCMYMYFRLRLVRYIIFIENYTLFSWYIVNNIDGVDYFHWAK